MSDDKEGSMLKSALRLTGLGKTVTEQAIEIQKAKWVIEDLIWSMINLDCQIRKDAENDQNL